MGRLGRNLMLLMLSLALHIVALATAGVWFRADTTNRDSDPTDVDSMVLSWVDPPEAPAALAIPVPEPTPEPPPPEPPPPEPQVTQLGERDGSGDALSTLDAEQELRAQQADDDQALSRVEPTPAAPEATQVEPEPAIDQVVEPAREQRDSRPAVPELIPTEQGIQSPTDLADAPSPGEAGTGLEVSDRNDAREQPPTDPVEAQTASPASESASPPARVVEPDPGAASYTDSDPFSTKFAAEFQSGKTNARGGRAFSVRRPRIDLGFRADATRLGAPIACTFRITIDASGYPTVVEVVRSSGSERIDQATRLALFEAWFDPDGGPRAFNFAIIYR
jgi:outer membrane biosynthesis protein TonB